MDSALPMCRWPAAVWRTPAGPTGPSSFQSRRHIQTVENLIGRKQKYLEVTTVLVLLRQVEENRKVQTSLLLFHLFSDTAKGYLVGQIMLDHGEGSSDLPRNNTVNSSLSRWSQDIKTETVHLWGLWKKNSDCSGTSTKPGDTAANVILWGVARKTWPNRLLTYEALSMKCHILIPLSSLLDDVSQP